MPNGCIDGWKEHAHLAQLSMFTNGNVVFDTGLSLLDQISKPVGPSSQLINQLQLQDCMQDCMQDCTMADSFLLPLPEYIIHLKMNRLGACLKPKVC